MTVVTIKIDGADRFKYKLGALERRIADPTMVLNRIADDMMRVIGATFDSQGRRHGGSWKPLTKATIREKKSRKILVASGALKRSYSIRGDSNQRLSVTPTGIALDSSVEYGEYHQTGAGHNPKREFIKFYPQDHARWTKMIEKDLMAAYRGGRTR